MDEADGDRECWWRQMGAEGDRGGRWRQRQTEEAES